jgi:hypothetical protein
LLPIRALHELRDIIDVLQNTAVEIYEAKQKALAEGDREAELKISEGKDIMSILCQFLIFLSWFSANEQNYSEGEYECLRGRSIIPGRASCSGFVSSISFILPSLLMSFARY